MYHLQNFHICFTHSQRISFSDLIIGVGAPVAKLLTPTPGMIGCFQPGISLSFLFEEFHRNMSKICRNICGYFSTHSTAAPYILLK